MPEKSTASRTSKKRSWEDYEWKGDGVKTRTFRKSGDKKAATRPKARPASGRDSTEYKPPSSRNAAPKKSVKPKARPTSAKGATLNSDGSIARPGMRRRAVSTPATTKAKTKAPAPATTKAKPAAKTYSGRGTSPGAGSTSQERAAQRVQADRSSGKNSSYFGIGKEARQPRRAKKRLDKGGNLAPVKKSSGSKGRRDRRKKG